jgi:hypothetical protein
MSRRAAFALALALLGCGSPVAPSRLVAPVGVATPSVVRPKDLPALPATMRSPAGFVHPGILVNRDMLLFVRERIAAAEEPWTSALRHAEQSAYNASDFTPRPREVVLCGPYSNPNQGCSDELRDAVAAYTQALLWAYTGDRSHAQRAIRILNAWSALLRDHVGSNAALQAAWAAQVFTRAAEIIRYSDAGWSAQEVQRFAELLQGTYLPEITRVRNGNWETSMTEAALNIAIFNDDRPGFERALARWRARTPAYVYSEKDGSQPLLPPGETRTRDTLWHGQTYFFDGVSQETCRDLHHAQYGLAGIINAAETAYLQGVDLYAEEATRLRAGLELHARLLNGEPVPPYLCGGSLNRSSPDPMWEIALNHFVNRRGEQLLQSERLARAIRPTDVDHHMCWETLTHAGVGDGKRAP